MLNKINNTYLLAVLLDTNFMVACYKLSTRRSSLKLETFALRLYHGFSLGKQDDYFQITFDHRLKQAAFFRQLGGFEPKTKRGNLGFGTNLDKCT